VRTQTIVLYFKFTVTLFDRTTTSLQHRRMHTIR